MRNEPSTRHAKHAGTKPGTVFERWSRTFGGGGGCNIVQTRERLAREPRAGPCDDLREHDTRGLVAGYF